MPELGPVTQMQLQDPIFSEILWKLTPASLAVRLSQGRFHTWNYVQLLSRKLVDVAMGRCPRLVVVMPPRHGKPQCKNGLILLPNGSTKRLGDIKVGDYVVTHRSRGRKVLAIFEHPGIECVKIVTKTGRELVSGLDHTMMTSAGWVKAGQLRIGQGLATLRHFEANRPSERLNWEFRLAGYICGDGSVISKSVVCVTDEHELSDIIQCVEDVEGVGVKTIIRGLSFSGLRPWLRDVGLFGKGAYTKAVPDWVFTASNAQIIHFLATYFATDGAINDPNILHKSGDREGGIIGCVVEYCSVSKELLRGTQSLLSRLDIISNVRVKNGLYKGERHKSWRLVISDRRSLLNFLELIGPRVVHSHKSSMVRQWSVILPTLPSREPKLTIVQIADIKESPLSFRKLAAQYDIGERVIWNIKKNIGKNLPHSEEYFYDEVVQLTTARADCRCLTVEEDETFVINDFVVHNSELVSKWFPVWYTENFQDKRIILASYEAEFAAKWGGKARDIISDNQDSLTVRFKVKNPAMHYWETTHDGAMMCAGVGGPVTGKGANVFIIDDPVKNAEEANSLTMREKSWEWYTSTARTRLEPGGAMVVMATRWHSDDLIGRLINPEFSNTKGIREEWEVFCFPACAEPETERHYRQFGVRVNDLRMGAMNSAVSDKSIREVLANEENPEWRDVLGRKRGEALCPERYDENDLARVRGVNLRDWYSLFQQRPGEEADDGNVYHQFDERVNCRTLVRDEAMQLFISMDFNVDPMCATIGQYDKGMGIRNMERCEVLQEIIIPNSNTPDMMSKLIIELAKYKWGYTLEVEVYGDAAGTQRSSQSQKSNWQIVKEYFMLDTSIHPRFLRRKANPAIVDRVNAMNTMLKSADGSIRLYVDDVLCPELVKDFKKVRWQVDSSGNSSGLLDKRDKRRTHISDALGYMVEYNFALKTRAGGRKGVLQ